MDKKITILAVVGSVLLLIGGVLLTSRSGGGSKLTGEVNSQDLLGDARNSSGKADAVKVLVEYADFQCPACAQSYPAVKEIVNTNKDKIRFVYRHFPLNYHKNALVAAQTAEAAGQQGKFWEMSEILYTKQTDWAESDKALEIFGSYAKELNLDIDKFNKSMTDQTIKDQIQKDYSDGVKVGVDSTPSFYFNNQKFTGNLSDLKALIEKD